MPPLLAIRDLSVTFATRAGPLTAVDHVSFSLEASGTLGIVGESGSGKSVTALSVLGLLRDAQVKGEVLFDGKNVAALPEPELRRLRGNRIAMVFQDPMASLNPSMRVGDQIAEPLRLHRGLSAEAAHAQAVALLESVGVPAAATRAREYPHHLSGGLRQRVMIAIALSCSPALLIADEPTTALDVTVQAQVMQLLATLQRERGMALLLISHDLGLVSEVCRELVVMYAGQIVEQGPAERLLKSPRHPYTAGLLASTPTLEGTGRLKEIPGTVPDLRALCPGCRFADRCFQAREVCRAQPVPLADGHRCLFPLDG